MQYKQFVFLSICALFLSAYANAAKQPLLKETPNWVKTPPIVSNKVNERDVTDGYYYLLINQQLHVATQANFQHLILKTINDIGVQNASEIEINYEPSYQTLHIHFIKVIRDGKTINKLNLADIKTLQRETDLDSKIYDGRYTAYINLKDVRKNDIIEYAYTIIGRNPVYENKFFYDLSTEYSFPVSQIHYRVVCPRERSLQIKQHTTNYACKKITERGNTIYEWNLSCEKVKETEEQTPKWFNPYGYIELSEYTNWSEVVNWALPLYKTNTPLSSELKKKIAEINTGSSESKILATMHFVQDEIRYMGFEMGVNSHKPNDPNKVFAQRFGDCKDKSLLMCRMLQEMNIEAYPNLINTNSTRALENWLPSPACFNHVTVCVYNENKQYWIDPTDSYQSGTLNSIQYPAYEKTLIVKSGEQLLTDVPLQNKHKITVHETFVVKDTASPIILRIISTYEGTQADSYRYLFSSQGLGDIEKDYTNYYKSIYGDVSLESKITTADDTEQNIFKVYEEYLIKNLWKDKDGAKQIEVGPYLLFNAISSEDIKKRKMPYALSFPFDYTQIIEVKFPHAIPITEETKTITDPHFKYTYDFKNEGGNSIALLYYHFETLKNTVQPEDSYGYFTKIDDFKQTNAYYFNWNPNPDESFEAIESNMNWVLLFLAIVGSIGFLFLCLFLYKKDVEPKHEAEFAQQIGGWLILILISMILSLLLNTYQIFTSGYFNLAGWIELTTPGKSSYHPMWAPCIIFELIFKLGFVAFVILLLVLFKERRSSFPGLYILLLAANIVFMLFELFITYKMPKVDANDTSSEILNGFVRSIISGAIWIPYMLKSWRVKETFAFTYDVSKQKKLVTDTTETPPNIEPEVEE